MATVRFEIKKFGRTRGAPDAIVPAITGLGLSGVFTPTGTTQVAFGPVQKECEVVVKAINT